MRFCGAGVLWLFTACGLSIAVVHLGAQGLSAPNASSVGPHSVGPQAVKVILKHFAINQLASDPNTDQPLRVDGSWTLGKNRPEGCPSGSTRCVEVFYSVPAQSAKCSWVVSMDESGADGTVLDENDDADRYMLRTLTTSEGLPLVKSRVKPVTPPIAVAARVSGSVVTEVLVSKTGEVEKMRPISGPPMLIPASIEAAKKWTFAPLLIGSRPVQYQMQVEFTFFAPIASMPGAIKMAP